MQELLPQVTVAPVHTLPPELQAIVQGPSPHCRSTPLQAALPVQLTSQA